MPNLPHSYRVGAKPTQFARTRVRTQLGFVSMLMGISSEVIHSLLPLFMVTFVARLGMPGSARAVDERA